MPRSKDVMVQNKKLFGRRKPILCPKCRTQMVSMHKYAVLRDNREGCIWYVCPRRKASGENGCGYEIPVETKGLKENFIKVRQKAERGKVELERFYRELQQNKDRLVQSEILSFAGRTAPSLAHEIRNPLNMMVMSSQLLQKRVSKDASSQELVDVFIRNLERIDHLVTELVNCARPPRLKVRNYNIHKVIESVINTVKEKCNTQNIKIAKNFYPKIPSVRIDKEHIEQAILNIVKNAIEAMPEGGTLTFSTNCAGDNLFLNIADTGKGILNKDTIKVFDPFFTTKKGGTGLGLAVCYAIIGSHNGFINLESSKKGTNFTITLPL